ncbi:AT-hook motif nuclear-localized protein 28-like [Papaver somniferum]|uniref:AT-hook motif nuclear-localized protein 28-like n=1 Tax=Papaver somniferum TaxID=3469 RepID=UPI000E6FA37D|nr:AT-hook motif nuclear-localized protein 28-like [Papaver somniferum]
MKGRDHEITQNPNNMFQKFHHQQQQQHHYQHQQQQLHHQQQQLSSRDQCQTSEEDDCRSNDNNSTINLQEPTKKIKKDNQLLLINNGSGSGSAGGGGDGATIEVVRRPRGRPPGSKNRPKPPVVITQNIPTDECAMRPHVLEIPIGVDIINAITRFSRRHNIGVCVLSGSGSVANVSLHQPSTTPGATVTFHGRFEILSISATFVPPSSSLSAIISGFSISLAGPQGQIFGGSVVGSLVAASTVFVVASSFNNPSFHRLPVEDDDNEQVRNNNNSSVSGGVTTTGGGGGGGVGSEERDSHSTPQPTTTSPQIDHHHQSMYHLPNDVIWAPTPRQQSHHYPLPPY